MNSFGQLLLLALPDKQLVMSLNAVFAQYIGKSSLSLRESSMFSELHKSVVGCQEYFKNYFKFIAF